MLRPARNLDAIRRQRCKTHRITYNVAPQACIGTNHHCIVFAQFHFAQRNCSFFRSTKNVHRYKFVKNTVIKHQQHLVRFVAVLYSKKTFGSIISFIVPKSFRRN